MRKLTQLLFFFIFWNTFSQNDSIQKYWGITSVRFSTFDSIQFHHTSTNPDFFKVKIQNSKFIFTVLDTAFYKVNFTNSTFFLNPIFFDFYQPTDSLEIHYKTFPEFLTKSYAGYDKTKIFPNPNSREVVSLEGSKAPIKGKPFEGLETQGNLIRGITIGNNQDAVLNSSLDLKIEGKINPNVQLNARINDTNIPIQENGYSQELKDIDRVYMELIGPKWAIKAGDIMLKDSMHYFLNFTKKVQGISIGVQTDKISVFSSGALVKGQYANYQFQGQESNQGPYKLQGENGELYIFIINGSEKIYINGILQFPGENRDYLIDYNTGEIVFTTNNPITSDMRITAEYQYSERNFTRLLTHNSVNYQSEKFTLGAAFYKESDLKNQTLELNLTDEQKNLLANAGNSSNVIYTTHETETTFDVGKILYKKINSGGLVIYEYSTDDNETLFQVQFTYFGKSLGDYQIKEYRANGKIMMYVGENKGDYKAVVPLTAPSSQQMIVLNSTYHPTEKTNISYELAFSNNDPNLFSNEGNNINRAPAFKANFKQTLWEKRWKATTFMQFDYVDKNFKNPERLYQIEFNRDWNVNNKMQNQSLFNGLFNVERANKGQLFYQFENLQSQNAYRGIRHQMGADLKLNKWQLNQWSSVLNSSENLFKTQFIRNKTELKFTTKKWWTIGEFHVENNQIKLLSDKSLMLQSFRNIQEKWSFGVGDSTRFYLKTGLHFAQNDSVRQNRLKAINQSKSWFLESQLLQTENVKMQLYVNYRNISYVLSENLESFNTRLTYQQQIFKKLLFLQSDYQNTSGQVAQQDYTYVETEPGQGYYTWIDYNENGLKELDEFEISQFADMANYLRFSLPNLSYLPTQESKLIQNITLNPSLWAKERGVKKFLSHWYNQLNITAQNSKKRTQNSFNFNPFDFNDEDVLNNLFNLKNQLIFNRGKSHYTSAYTYGNSNQKTWQSFGSIYQNRNFHQLDFQHLIERQWQLGLETQSVWHESENETYSNRNFSLKEWSIKPNIVFYVNKTHWIKGAFEWADKKNIRFGKEQLSRKKLQLDYQYTSKNDTFFSAEFSLLKNNFIGNPNTAVGYQLLEGLQSGVNATWNMLWSKKINSFLYLNMNYMGRSNELSRTIHSGNVQLRANF